MCLLVLYSTGDSKRRADDAAAAARAEAAEHAQSCEALKTQVQLLQDKLETLQSNAAGAAALARTSATVDRGAQETREEANNGSSVGVGADVAPSPEESQSRPRGNAQSDEPGAFVRAQQQQLDDQALTMARLAEEQRTFLVQQVGWSAQWCVHVLT